ncbi:MAG: efflux RND transporter periplasmic adaptor subunit, partial [Myxococcota bacterium]
MRDFLSPIERGAAPLALAAALLASTACEKEVAVAEPPIRPVKYAVVEASGGQRTHVFSGESSASIESRLSFKVAGTVRRVAVKVGDQVKKDQLIAEIDRTDYQLQLQQAQAQAASARAQERNAKASYERVEKMYESESASRSDLDAARASYQTARANVSSAGQQVQLARQQLSYTRLTAPIAGSIAQVPVEPNENVASGQTVVLLTAGDRPKVTVAVADRYIREVDNGSTVRVNFPDLPGQTFEAVVSEVSPTSSGTGATVTALLSEPSSEVRPGMSADITFTFGSPDDKQRLLIPPAAVGEDRAGTFVFAIGEAAGKGPEFGTIRRVGVTVNPEPTAEGIEILDGIKSGDRVVTAGRTRISD